MITELADDEVEKAVNGRIVLKLPVFMGEFEGDLITEFLSDLEERLGPDSMEIIIHIDNNLMHRRVDGGDRSKSELCGILLRRLHLDALPITTVILTIPKNSENESVMRNAMEKHNIQERFLQA